MFQIFFTLSLFFAITLNCVAQKELLSAVSQYPSSTLENIILNPYINQTNISVLSFSDYDLNLKSTTRIRGEENRKRTLYEEENQSKGKLCLENVTHCMQQDDDYRSTLEYLSKKLFRLNPQIDFISTKEVNSKCKLQSLQYQRSLEQFKLWALRMYDSNAKISSGLLNGNVNQLGDFDSCLSIQSDDLTIKGHYCLAAIQIKTPTSAYLSAIHNLLHSHYAFKSNLDDPGHRVPRYSSINWAVCVPNSCTSKDVELAFKESLKDLLNGTNINFDLKVEPSMCYQSDSERLPLSTILASTFFIVIALTALFATMCDYCEWRTHELIYGFSLRKNITSLLSTKRDENDITAVHGIRFVNACILLGAHKSLALFFMPFTNRTEMTETFGQQWSVLGRAASLYTDPFIMISGTLTAFSLFSKLEKNKKINIAQEYISRWFRIVPPLAALILFCTFVLPWLNSGPQWNLVVTHHAEKCKQYWWRNMLFVHNYFGFQDICLTHTHHVGIDMQLFFLAPFAILLIWKFNQVGIIILSCLAVISTVMRYYVTITKNLSNYIHFGTSIQQLFDTADNMYILPFHRATVYIMGILLGYFLRQSKKNCFSSFQLLIGNILATISFYVSFLGASFMGKINYVYDPVHAAWYASFAPIFWCASFAWVIFTTHVGQAGILGRLFSWRGFIVATRISYAVYLTQFPIFFYKVGTVRTPEFYNVSKLLDVSECLWVIICSVFLTLLFDLPFQNMKQIIQRRKYSTVEVQNKVKLN